MKKLSRKKWQHNPNDTIELRGLNKTVLWGELDRWDYANPDVPSGTPPPYTLYTFLTLKEAFQVFLVIMGAHTLLMLIIKMATSTQFRTKTNLLGKFIHIIQNLRGVFKIYPNHTTKNFVIREAFIKKKHFLIDIRQ